FQPSSYQELFMVSLVFEIVLFPVIYFLRRGAEATNGGRVIDQISRGGNPAGNFLRGFWEKGAKSGVDSRIFFDDWLANQDFTGCCCSLSSSDFSRRSSCKWITSFQSSAFANSARTLRSGNFLRSTRS